MLIFAFFAALFLALSTSLLFSQHCSYSIIWYIFFRNSLCSPNLHLGAHAQTHPLADRFHFASYPYSVFQIEVGKGNPFKSLFSFDLIS